MIFAINDANLQKNHIFCIKPLTFGKIAWAVPQANAPLLAVGFTSPLFLWLFGSLVEKIDQRTRGPSGYVIYKNKEYVSYEHSVLPSKPYGQAYAARRVRTGGRDSFVD